MDPFSGNSRPFMKGLWSPPWSLKNFPSISWGKTVDNADNAFLEQADPSLESLLPRGFPCAITSSVDKAKYKLAPETPCLSTKECGRAVMLVFQPHQEPGFGIFCVALSRACFCGHQPTRKKRTNHWQRALKRQQPPASCTIWGIVFLELFPQTHMLHGTGIFTY